MQSTLRSKHKTWVKLPKHRWPEHWEGKFKDPVVPLVLALYGHVDSGGYWEQKAHKELTERGFEEIEDWKSCFWHPTYKMLLVLYVDDFKLAGPQEHMTTVWKLIRENILMGEPQMLNHFLGCTHEDALRKLETANW